MEIFCAGNVYADPGLCLALGPDSGCENNRFPLALSENADIPGLHFRKRHLECSFSTNLAPQFYTLFALLLRCLSGGSASPASSAVRAGSRSM
jgi:hypothetical protein